jgi:hypothetical protein
MSLNVELELLAESHTNRGVALVKGDKFDTDPRRAQRLIDAGMAKKIGVVELNEATDDVVEAEAEAPVDPVGDDE